MAFDEPIVAAPPKLPRNAVEKESHQRVIVVLDRASLDTTRLGSSKKRGDDKGGVRYALLSGEEHSNILRKMGKDPAESRPDITHQCLMTLLDSPLSKAGKLQIYIRTQRGILIEVSPLTRIPRTYGRFSGLMVQLLHKLSVKSQASSEKLLNIIKNPIDQHLPIRHIKIGFSSSGPVMKARDFVGSLPADQTPVIYIGAMAHGEDSFEGVEASISVSQYPLTASVACGKLCDAFEDLWGIL